MTDSSIWIEKYRPKKFEDIITLPKYHKDIAYLGYPIVIKRPDIIKRRNFREKLEKAGIEMDGYRLKVDEYLRTTNKNVYVCGDIAGSYQFTHAAEMHAGIIINNFFSPRKKKLSNDNLAWVT